MTLLARMTSFGPEMTSFGQNDLFWPRNDSFWPEMTPFGHKPLPGEAKTTAWWENHCSVVKKPLPGKKPLLGGKYPFVKTTTLSKTPFVSEMPFSSISPTHIVVLDTFCIFGNSGLSGGFSHSWTQWWFLVISGVIVDFPRSPLRRAVIPR